MNKIVNIRIKGSPWVVKFVDSIDNSDSGVSGLTNYNSKVIMIENVSCDIYNTIIHELLHATLFECGSDLCHDESLVFLLANIFDSIVSNFVVIRNKIKHGSKEEFADKK